MKPDKHRWKCVPRRNRLRIQHEAIPSDSRYIHTTSLTYPFNSASTPTSPLTPVLLPTRNAVIQSLSGLSCCLPLFLPDQLEYSQPLSPSQTLSGLYPSVIMYSSSVIHYISPSPLSLHKLYFHLEYNNNSFYIYEFHFIFLKPIASTISFLSSFCTAQHSSLCAKHECWLTHLVGYALMLHFLTPLYYQFLSPMKAKNLKKALHVFLSLYFQHPIQSSVMLEELNQMGCIFWDAWSMTSLGKYTKCFHQAYIIKERNSTCF